MSGKRQAYLLPPLLFDNVLKVVARAISQEKKIKGIQIGMETIKQCLLADNMSLHRENPKKISKRLLELINEFRKITGYKISIQNSTVLLYACNK